MVSGEDIAKFISAVIIISFVVIIMGFVTGKYFEINIVKGNYEEYGKAINLLNAIGASSGLASKDSTGEPLKLVLDKDKLFEFSQKHEQELECCNYYDYDYSLQIKDLRTGEAWTVGFTDNYVNSMFRKGKRCIQIDQSKGLSRYSIPATITDGENVNPGVMNIKLVETPLSNIVYSTAVACTKNVYNRVFNIYNIYEKNGAIEVEDLGSDEYRICIFTSQTEKRCKILSCETEIEIKAHAEPSVDDCYDTEVKREGDKVIIVVPQKFI